jgi:mRNA interferase RelE/StbE
MTFEIIWNTNASRELEKLEKIIARRIFKKISELKENPYSKDLIKLKTEEGFRLRVGDYRIILVIEKDKILILKIGHRKNIYG